MMKNPSMIVSPFDRVPEKASRLDLMVLERAAAGIVFRRLPRGFWNIWVFIELRGGGWVTMGPTTHQGTLGASSAPSCLVGPTGAPLGPRGCLLGRKDSPKSFTTFGLHLIWIFCEIQKHMQKIGTSTGTRSTC